MTSPETRPLVLAITACPTGIAHTYMAAENLEAAADTAGVRVRVETHGSIGVENAFTADEIRDAAAVVVAADMKIDTARFVGKPLVSTGVDDGIKKPAELLRSALDAPKSSGDDAAGVDGSGPDDAAGDRSWIRRFGDDLYRALMNGVSHMIPFVVTGGLMLAVALSLGGEPTAEGLVIPEGTFWDTLNQLGGLAFSLMVPVLSGYIAMAIADRPGLAPGFVTGLVAVTGDLYGSEADAGFLGGIVTGVLSGYVALAIRKIPVHKYIQPIWPIIVIPVVTTLVVGGLFIYLLGKPIATLFEVMTESLEGMQGSSVLLLGAIIGAMIAFDMGGPLNKTAFLFAGGLIATGNAAPMGMAAVAIAVPPIAAGVTTLLARSRFNKAERDAGVAGLFMGFFGISEGAIPLAVARPLQIIPANVIGGAVAGALAGMFGVKDNVMHGGPIVAVLGAVEGIAWFFLCLVIGIVVTSAVSLLLMALTTGAPGEGKSGDADTAPDTEPTSSDLIDADTVVLDLVPATGQTGDSGTSADAAAVIRALAGQAEKQGRLSETEVVEAALAREAQSTTAVGNGVAIPHARSAAVSVPTLAFGRLQTPVEWDAPDSEAVDLVFLIAVPDDAGKQHLKVLAKLARALMKDDFRESLRSAPSSDDVVNLVKSLGVEEVQGSVSA
ncbi:fructose-specific PTS transporter subunit EIIC [Corynebacterium glyciniphilum]|uniref:fructose-specific PTS transporter subunit EIIC n=1 Tax=Corynebacterium glyciniphilum TaxID=1404244 RepID=UPI0026521EE2|nr:fructose-specific PTS transporter subunit EIIC [Corynebacterium glyciniphilum]MDN6707381.1 fructose-specific PTS transporter subunit EIIC [Corynebacterium glyciniphilum]